MKFYENSKCTNKCTTTHAQTRICLCTHAHAHRHTCICTPLAHITHTRTLMYTGIVNAHHASTKTEFFNDAHTLWRKHYNSYRAERNGVCVACLRDLWRGIDTSLVALGKGSSNGWWVGGGVTAGWGAGQRGASNWKAAAARTQLDEVRQHNRCALFEWLPILGRNAPADKKRDISEKEQYKPNYPTSRVYFERACVNCVRACVVTARVREWG